MLMGRWGFKKRKISKQTSLIISSLYVNKYFVNYIFIFRKMVSKMPIISICGFLSSSNDYSFFEIWSVLSLLSLLSLTAFSTISFNFLYVRPTFQMWRYKINPDYPPPIKVREEIIVMMRGLFFSTIPPALSIYLAKQNIGYGYCVVDELHGGWTYLFQSFFVVWICTGRLQLVSYISKSTGSVSFF